MHGLSCSPVVPPSLSALKCGTTCSTSHCLVGSASCSLACPVPQSTTSLGPPAPALLQILSAWLPASDPPTGLDECFFFISLVVGLPYSLIFCQFWLFLFLNCCCPSFGCARRHSMSTYTFILARSPRSYFLKLQQSMTDKLHFLLCHFCSDFCCLRFPNLLEINQ